MRYCELCSKQQAEWVLQMGGWEPFRCAVCRFKSILCWHAGRGRPEAKRQAAGSMSGCMEGHLIRGCIRSTVFAIWHSIGVGCRVQLRCGMMQQARAVGSQAFKLLVFSVLCSGSFDPSPRLLNSVQFVTPHFGLDAGGVQQRMAQTDKSSSVASLRGNHPSPSTLPATVP